MSQDEVREKLKNYLAESGVKQIHISDKTGIYNGLLSEFKRGRKDLWENHLKILYEYIDKECKK